MLRNVLKLLGLFVFLVFITGTFIFVMKAGRNMKCSVIDVKYSDRDIIKLSRNDIIAMVKKADSKVIGKELKNIDTEKIENVLYLHPAIRKVDIYKIIARDSASLKGVLAVKVYHRKPVVRIVSSNGEYYLDEDGHRIPVSVKYSADVKIISGNLTLDYAKKMLPLMIYIQDDKFWNAQISQVKVSGSGEISLVPLVGDQVIEFGSFENYEKKFRNLFAFYKQVLTKNNWDKYKMVSVKYKDQVIAKKR